VKIVEEFAKAMEKEIDYTIEAMHMERVSRQFIDDLTVYIPKVYNDLTTSKVLTAEYVEGIKITDLNRLDNVGLDRKLITTRGADVVLKQVFNHGFFHADPHPGNIHILPGNIICLLDFGMVGTIDRQTREEFVDLLHSIVNRHESRATQVLLKLTEWDEEPDIRQLEKEVADFMGRHLYKPLKDIEIGKLLQQLLELTSEHMLRIPPDIFMMLKAFTTVEGVARTLDPSFDMIAQAAPFIEQVKRERFHPQRIAADAVDLAVEWMFFLRQFPKDMLEITRLLRQQKLSVLTENKGQSTALETYDQISNRISFSIIIASLLVGSALIVISEIPPLFYGISLIGIIGFLAAALMGVWLLVAILRKGRL
jgi:ubiquinone biosynthesis protein